jgi:hypothetical protein
LGLQRRKRVDLTAAIAAAFAVAVAVAAAGFAAAGFAAVGRSAFSSGVGWGAGVDAGENGLELFGGPS